MRTRAGQLDSLHIKMQDLIQRLQVLTAGKVNIFPHTLMCFNVQDYLEKKDRDNRKKE